MSLELPQGLLSSPQEGWCPLGHQGPVRPGQMVEGYSPLRGETVRVEGLRMLEMGFEHGRFGCMVPQVLGTLGCSQL